MNKRLEKEFGECVVEKHGWHWVLTKDEFESWIKIDDPKT